MEGCRRGAGEREGVREGRDDVWRGVGEGKVWMYIGVHVRIHHALFCGVKVQG